MLWIGVETDEFAASKMNPADVFRRARDHKLYRRLVPGDFVKRDQAVALLDDEQAFLDYQGAKTKADAAKQSATSYEDTVYQLKQIVAQEEEGVVKGAVPRQELYNSKATLARYRADQVDHQGSAAVAAADLSKAKYILDKHSLRAPFDGQVQQVLKHEGEGVKAQEPVVVIHDFAKLRAIGNLPKEYVNVVCAGTT